MVQQQSQPSTPLVGLPDRYQWAPLKTPAAGTHASRAVVSEVVEEKWRQVLGRRQALLLVLPFARPNQVLAGR